MKHRRGKLGNLGGDLLDIYHSYHSALSARVVQRTPPKAIDWNIRGSILIGCVSGGSLMRGVVSVRVLLRQTQGHSM